MKIIKKYQDSIIYSVLMALAFLSWSFNLSLIVFTLFAVLFIVNVFYYKKDHYNVLLILLLPTLFNDIVDSAFMEDFQDLSRYYIFIVPIVSLYGVMILKIINNRKNIQNKALALAILVYFASMIPSFINSLNIYNSLLESIIYLNAVLLFLYVTTSTNIKKEDFYFIIILFALQGIMQMSYVLIEGDTLEMIATKAIGVGWSKQNNLAQYAAFALSFVLYFAVQYKKSCNYLYYSLAVIFVVSVFLTSARTTILSLVIIFIPMMIYLYKNSSKKELKRNLAVVSLIAIIALTVLTSLGITETFIDRMLHVRLDSTLRVKHWVMAIDHFLDYPLFGSGVLTTSEYISGLPSYHNLFVDALTNTGIIGFAGTVYFLYVIVKQLRSNKNNYIVSIALVTFFVAAMLDTVHLNPITLMMFFMSLHFIEYKPTEDMI